MRLTGGRGVSVVLNSLAGEAMERSLGLAAAFWPVRRTRQARLSRQYADRTEAVPAQSELFWRRSRPVALRRGRNCRIGCSPTFWRCSHLAICTPLPYSVFGHDEVIEAMRLMQQSGHIGKILIRPPRETARIQAGTADALVRSRSDIAIILLPAAWAALDLPQLNGWSSAARGI